MRARPRPWQGRVHARVGHVARDIPLEHVGSVLAAADSDDGEEAWQDRVDQQLDGAGTRSESTKRHLTELLDEHRHPEALNPLDSAGDHSTSDWTVTYCFLSSSAIGRTAMCAQNVIGHTLIADLCQ
eukprot:4407008-Amphidinium_carterae.1